MSGGILLGNHLYSTYAGRRREGVKSKAYAPYKINLFPYSKAVQGREGSKSIAICAYVLYGWPLRGHP